MGYRVFIIEHPSSPPLPAWLQDENLCGLSIAGRSLWQDFSGEQISRLQEQIVLASALPKSEAVWNMFEWLREHPIRVPTLALLPADDPELMRVAASTVDDFLVWPIHAEELRQRVFRLLGPASLKDVQNQLLGEMGMRQALGNAPAFLDALKRVAMFGPSIAPVMLTGETGTGKELFARILHMLSPRCRGPFIPVECGAVPEHLFENEMFGHARGAFTDAHAEQKGCAMLAVGGTLFLDEIDSLSLAAQGKLLRLIQERKFRPLGADQYREADVRIIAASNRDLAKLVDEKVFRCDLYFRLNVLRVHLPALRERPGDVALLARHFVESLSGSGGAQRKFLSPAALHKLES
jgi:DNA-binding NtrC family response regulator